MKGEAAAARRQIPDPHHLVNAPRDGDPTVWCGHIVGVSVAAEYQYCTFLLDGHYFGVDVLKVQEIIRFQEMTRVPLISCGDFWMR